MFCLPSLLVILLACAADVAHSAAVAQLTQETPCLPSQSCRLQCSVVSGTNDNGLSFRRGSATVVACPPGFDGTPSRDNCRSNFPGLYSLNQTSYTTSYLDIKSFDLSLDVNTWTCQDPPDGTPGTKQVVQNALPQAPLTFGNTCMSGHATSPATLTCSLGSPGIPAATVKLADSRNQTVGSSQPGSVTGTVITGGQVTCSVTWSAFPNYHLNINPVLCDVQVAASITSIRVLNGTNQEKVITCQAEGHPDTYTFQSWLQSWGGQEVRRVTGSQQGGQYSLTLTSYQDTGNYTCTVDNGVPDSSGQVIQRSASVNVLMQGVPVFFLSSNGIVAGEDGEKLRLHQSVYVVPDLANHNWFFNSTDATSLIPGATTNSSRDMVSLPVHGTTVTTEGTVINLYLTVSQQYSGLYRLQACNTIGCNSATVTVTVASAPSSPESLSAKPSTDRVELSWTPGFAGGGFYQWFHVQYRRQDSPEGQWSDVSTADNRSSSDRTPVTVTVQGLQPDTNYVFRVRAQSSRPQRNLSNYTVVELETNFVTEVLYRGSTLAAAVVATAVLSAAVATLVVLCITWHIWKNPRKTGQNASTVYQNVSFSRPYTSENINAGMEASDAVADNSQLSEAVGTYSVLDPVSRDAPRDPALYQRLAQSGLHGNQIHSTLSTEGQYSSAYDLAR